LTLTDTDRDSPAKPCSYHVLGPYFMMSGFLNLFRVAYRMLQGLAVNGSPGGPRFVENLAYASATAVSVLGWLVNVRREALITSCTRSRVPKVPEKVGDGS
jgi:hypothetical protein